MFAIVDFAARKGLGAPSSAHSTSGAAGDSAKHRARQTGIRGETYAYWYLRRQGYILVARNFTPPGIKGEIDMVGCDGQTLAFVEVMTRTVIDSATSSQSSRPLPLTPEEAVNWEKRRNLTRMAGQFLRARHIEKAACRFDVLAIETRPGQRPVRLHKGAFNATQQQHPPGRCLARNGRVFDFVFVFEFVAAACFCFLGGRRWLCLRLGFSRRTLQQATPVVE
jgi:putative endonuclease